MLIDDLMNQLGRAEVSEVALQADRLPCAAVDGKLSPYSEAAVSRAQLEALVHQIGGAQHLERGGGQWSFRCPLGVVDVLLGVRGEQLLARFKLRGAPIAEAAAPRRASQSPKAATAPRSSTPPKRKSSRSMKAVTASEPKRARSRHPRPPGDEGALDALLAEARRLRASDLHVVAERPALLRVAGELRPLGEPLHAAEVEALLTPRIPERLRQGFLRDGSADFALVHESHGRFRANVSRQRTGLKATLRLLPARVPTLAELGLPEQIAAATHHHQGLIIVTGPTGHGKTTTLAALVDVINATKRHHVLTVEDPIEFLHPQKLAIMSQREVGTHTQSFASALKASLREDPDVIVVGELRDTETVRMAVAASETGHLVLSTMNTPSAAKTIERIIDLFPPSDQPQVRMTLAGGLRLVVSQRLVPNASGDGVVAAMEVLPGSPALWSLIRDNKTFQIPSLQQRGKALGIVRLDDSLAEHVRAGRVALETALEWAESPDELRANLEGPRAAAPSPEAAKRPAPAAPAVKEAAGALLQRAGSLFNRGGGS